MATPSTIQLATYAYVCSNSFRLLSYVPQMIAIARDGQGVRAIALPTWWFWLAANTSAVVYASIVVGDGLFALINAGNALGCMAILAMTLYKRHRYRNADSSQDLCRSGCKPL